MDEEIPLNSLPSDEVVSFEGKIIKISRRHQKMFDNINELILKSMEAI